MGIASDKIRVRVGVILPYNNKLLMLRQNRRDFWVLPGGTLEPGETLATCARRELEEETELLIKVKHLFAVSEFIQADKHVVDTFFLAELNPDSYKEKWNEPYPENIDAIAWMDQPTFAATAIKPEPIAKLLLKAWHNNWELNSGEPIYVENPLSP